MGYYVTLIESTFSIPAEHLDEAYRRLCALNDDDAAKQGGGWYQGGQLTADDPRPEGLDHHPARWFSWMDANYPAKCETAEAIFEALGFGVEHGEDGSLRLTGYDDKTGQEDLFLEAVAELATGRMKWRGEDDDLWGYDYDEGRPLVAEVVWFSADPPAGA